MKNLTFFCLIALVSTFFGCEKSETYTPVSKQFDGQLILRNNSTYDSLDSYVILEFDEYIDDIAANVSALFAGGFRGVNGNLIDAGTILVNNDTELDLLSDNRFLLNNGIDAEDLIGDTILVSFDPSSPGFSSFEEDIYIPKQMKVTSNIGTGDYFEKNQDLVLRWEEDERIDLVYIGICAEGKPCIFITTEDDGEFSVQSSEFSGFLGGSKVFVHIVRGVQKCFSSDSKEICIFAFNNARTSSHVVQ